MAPDSPLPRLVAKARSRDLSRDETQEIVTRDILLPRLGEIRSALLNLRREVDARFRARAAKADHPFEEDVIDPARYPVGFCRPICRDMLAAMEKDALFQEFRRQGARWKLVYVIIEGHFENAIQLGNLYISPAHDSVEGFEPAADVWPLEEIEHENLECWERVAEITEQYLDVTLYPNLHFPLLAPLMPFFARQRSGRMGLLLMQYSLTLKDLDEGFPRLRKFYAGNSKWLARRLPAEAEARIERHFGENRQEVFPVEWRRVTPEGIVAEVLPDFERARDDVTLGAGIVRLLQGAKELSVRFHQAGVFARG